MMQSAHRLRRLLLLSRQFLINVFWTPDKGHPTGMDQYLDRKADECKPVVQNWEIKRNFNASSIAIWSECFFAVVQKWDAHFLEI